MLPAVHISRRVSRRIGAPGRRLRPTRLALAPRVSARLIGHLGLAMMDHQNKLNAVGEHSFVVSIPIALETLFRIVFFLQS